MPMTTRSEPRPLAVRAITAARLLDCSRAHVYKLMERGELRRIRIPGSKSVRIPVEDVYGLLGMEPPKTGEVA
jgi:excisionase family DNA binding protein